jgi:glycosyltransferase involved in cell wall biosynthesis
MSLCFARLASYYYLQSASGGIAEHGFMAVAHDGSEQHVLINGLSVGSGGGYTVARELARHLSAARPESRYTLLLSDGNPLHDEMRRENLPPNCRLHFAPATAGNRLRRGRYERHELTRWAASEKVSAVVQLNGMIVPGMSAPTLCHFQDPWPYRPEAWSRGMRGGRDRFLALLKRRAHARALRAAAVCGFTSRYLRDLIIAAQGIQPRRAEVFYNGIPDDWIDRAARPMSPLADRPMEIVTVSNVNAYKRQSLVIRAMGLLKNEPGMQALVYRIVGECSPAMRAELTALAKSTGVSDRVQVEGRVSDERVMELLGRARAFVIMSVCESFGIPMIEAMSFGTPVIAADCCALPEVGGTAVDLSAVDDVDALAGHLRKILTDLPHADALRQRGAQRVEEFRWRSTAEQMAGVLDSISGVADAGK